MTDSVHLFDLLGNLAGVVEAPDQPVPAVIVYGTRAFMQDSAGVFREITTAPQAVAPITNGLIGGRNQDPDIVGWPGLG